MTNLAQDTAKQTVNGNGFWARNFHALRQTCADFLARSTLRAQFADLDRRGGLDEMLTDIGISRSDMEKIIRSHPESGRLLAKMTQRLGVDPEALDPRSRYELGRSCSVCQSHSRCRHWLANAKAESTEYRAFCPNAELLDAAHATPHQA